MAFLINPRFFQGLHHGLADMGDGVRHRDADGIEGLDLIRCCALAAGDDGARMAHALARRRLPPGDESCDRFFRHILPDPLCRIFFRRTADLADHEDGHGVVVLLEQFQRIDEIRPFEGSPPMPMAVVMPMPAFMSWKAAS